MNLGFVRRVETVFIDMDKMRELGIVDANYNEDVNGEYTCVIVPKNLMDKKVMLIPLNENETIMSLDEMLKEAKID